MERRKRTWPLKYLISKPTRENPRGSSHMLYAHEWEAYQKSIEAGQSPEEAIRTALGHFAPPAYAPESPSDLPDATTTPPGPDPATPSEPTVSGEGYGVPNEVRGSATSEGYGVPSEAKSTPSDEGDAIQIETRATLQASSPTISDEGYGVPNAERGDPSLPPDFDRHSRRCAVCSHPDRDAIEGEFIRWRSPKNIVRNHKIADASSLYRHAHATGLFARRRREFARVLEDILEIVEESSLDTADVIIRAARLYARLDENGNWFEPTRTNIILTGPAPGQFSENPDLEISAVPPNRPRKIPFKLASKLTEEKKAKKRLIATHPTSKSESNS